MATKEYHKVSLYRETATLTDESITPGAPSGTLKLGASGNFGVHTLQVELGEGWQGLTVHAIFWLSGEGVLGNSLLSGGEISVPAAVTASPTNVGFVTFSGTSAGVNRLTATLPFIVTDGPPSEGEPSPDPDPSLWQQLFDKMEEVVSTYILPIMSEETLGGGKAIKKTTETVPVAVDPLDGRLYVPEQSGGGGDYKLPQATESTLGGVKAKQRTSETLEVAIDASTGKLYVPQQGGGGSYILPVATSSILGGVKVKNKTDETVQVAADEQGFLYIKDYALKNEIPEKLPNPQPITFTGAATGSYDGSSSLEINIPSGGEFDINTATPSFTEAESRENINTGETIPVLFGKIKKWFTDLKAVAFSGNYSDLTGQPQALKNPQAITFTGAVSETYDGSEAKTINIPTGGTGTTDYDDLLNKPSIGGVTIEGNKSASDYSLVTKEELPKQATDTEAGIAKFKPITEQGDNVPANILPDGTVVVPPGGGSPAEWRHIRLVTVPEDAEYDQSGVKFAKQTNSGYLWAFDTDENGEKFSLKEVLIKAYSALDSASPNKGCDFGQGSEPVYGKTSIISVASDSNRYRKGFAMMQKIDNNWFAYTGSDVGSGLMPMQCRRDMAAADSELTSLRCWSSNAVGYGPLPGSTFDVYGR